MSNHKNSEDRTTILDTLKTSDSSFDPIGQYYLDKSKHRRTKKTPNTDLDDVAAVPTDKKEKKIAKLRTKARSRSHDNVNPFQKFFLTWLSPLVSLGRRANLVGEDIPAIPKSSEVKNSHPVILASWQKKVIRAQDREFNKIITKNGKRPMFLRNRVGGYQNYLRKKKTEPNLAPMEGKSIPPQTIYSHPAMRILPQHYHDRFCQHGNTAHKTTPYDGNQSGNDIKKLESEVHALGSIEQIEKENLAAKEAYPWLFPLLYLAHLFPLAVTVFGEVQFYALSLLQPMAIKGLSAYFTQHRASPDASTFIDGAFWALMLSLIILFSALGHLLKNQAQASMSMVQGGSITTMILEKTFRIAGWALEGDPTLSTGSVTNMLTADLQKVFFTPIFIHMPWSGLLAIFLCVGLMYNDIGGAALVCGVLMMLLLPYQYLMARVIGNYRTKLLKLGDERIKFVTQILAGIRVIKGYAFEEVLAEQIEVYRTRELAVQRKLSFSVWLNEIVSYTYPIFATFATIAFYVRFGQDLTPDTVFLILTYLNTIRVPIQFISMSLLMIIDFQVSSTRMSRLFAKEELPMFESRVRELIDKHQEELRIRQENEEMQKHGFVINDEDDDGYYNNNNDQTLNALGTTPGYNDPFALPAPTSPSYPMTPPGLNIHVVGNEANEAPLISLHHVDFYWSSFDKKPLQVPVLTDISFDLKPGEIITVIGQSATGKTALLSGILGNLYPQPHKTFKGLFSIPNIHSEITPGQYSFNNTIEIVPSTLMSVSHYCGYAAQQPFLMNNTLRNNIIMSNPFDQAKFQRVIECSALGPDLAVLPGGDLTIISDGGVSLSGGQSARVSFARVLYAALNDQIQVAVLDDIFAAVDSLVAKTMFFKGVCGILKDCGVILALNSHYDFLHSSTKTILLSPSEDQFWSTLQTELVGRRGEYEEYYNTRKQLLEMKKGIKTGDQNKKDSTKGGKENPYQQVPDSDDNNNNNNKSGFSEIKSPTGTNKSVASMPFSPTAAQLLARGAPQSTLANTPSDNNNNNNNDNTGTESNEPRFRPPSSIQYFGDVTGLMRLDHPLINSITLAQNHGSEEDDGDDRENDADSPHVKISNQRHQKWLEKLHKDEDANTSLSKKAGLVTDKNELKKVDDQLKQKVEQHAKAAAGGAPTQAKIPKSLYAEYFRGGNSDFGMWFTIALVVVVALSCQVFRTGVDLWMVEWATDVTQALATQQPQKHDTQYWITTSLFMLIMSATLGVAQVFIFLYVSINTSRLTHAKTIKRIFRATLGYLDTTPMGTLINALTRDIFIVDSQLPGSFISILQQILALIATLSLSIWTSPLLVLPLIPAVAYILYSRVGVQNTSVQMKRLESAAAQPMHSMFYGLLKGAAVLRSFSTETKNEYITRFREVVAKYLAAAMTLLLIDRRFAFGLNLTCSIYIFFLALLIILLRNHLDTTFGMLAITYSLRLTGTLQMTIRVLTMSQQNLTALHRLTLLHQNIPIEASFDSDVIACNYVKSLQPAQFKKLEQQEKINHEFAVANGTKPRYEVMADGTTKIDLHHRYHQQQKMGYWPWFGKIEFKNVTLRYRPELPIVLHNCSFTVQPGQHVGIAAKTGAGKSTTLLSLMRMINPEKGSVLIDGVDITKMGLGDLRSRMGLIPQQPTIFSGTVRSNLDPLSRYTDDELWLSLEYVSMIDKIKQLDNGLYSKVSENGGNFSSSERQLLCIARSLLAQPQLTQSANQQSNENQTSPGGGDFASTATPNVTPGSILLADEVTSSVSADSDALVQSTIRRVFAQSTILVIAHRLASIVDLDRILVLRPMTEELINQGVPSVLEFEVPFILLNNPESAFFQMCMSTGIDNFILLWLKAREAFDYTQKKEALRYGNYLRIPTIDYDNLPDELVTMLQNENTDNNVHHNTSPIFLQRAETDGSNTEAV